MACKTLNWRAHIALSINVENKKKMMITITITMITVMTIIVGMVMMMTIVYGMVVMITMISMMKNKTRSVRDVIHLRQNKNT